MIKGTTSEEDARTHPFWGSYIFRRTPISSSYLFTLYDILGLHPSGACPQSADCYIRRTPVIPYVKPMWSESPTLSSIGMIFLVPSSRFITI